MINSKAFSLKRLPYKQGIKELKKKLMQTTVITYKVTHKMAKLTVIFFSGKQMVSRKVVNPMH